MSGHDPLNELGFSTPAAGPEHPREVLVEAQAAERIGLGAAFVSERLNLTETGTLSGALGVATSNLGINAALADQHIRHPIVLASHALTMHKLTGGRYSLGLGLGRADRARELGLDPATMAKVADMAWLMRRLWAGETVVDHDGPAGRFPRLSLQLTERLHIPLTIDAFGPKSLALGGRVFDGVVLPMFFTEETTRRAVETIRLAAQQSSRDPASVRVWAVLPMIGPQLSADARLRRSVGRLASCLQADGDRLVGINGWDHAVLDRFRNDLFVRSFHGGIEGRASDSELDHVAELLPKEWLAPVASGDTDACARAIEAKLDLGVDGVVLDGLTPWEAQPVVEVYRRGRDPKRFARLKANPASLVRPIRPQRPPSDRMST